MSNVAGKKAIFSGQWGLIRERLEAGTLDVTSCLIF
jgi:hypothetical protein